MNAPGRSGPPGGTAGPSRRHGSAGSLAINFVPCRGGFISARSVAALPEVWLAEALHRQADGSSRGLCVAERLAHALRTGAVRCDGVEMAWAPPMQAAAAYAERRWGARAGGGEGAAHRALRGLAALYLSAAAPGCVLSLPPPRTPAGRRRPDLLAVMPGGGDVAVEVGAADADSVHVQIASQGADHLLVLPYAGGRDDGGPRGYVFRAAARPPLPMPSARGIRAAWATLSAAVGLPVGADLGRPRRSAASPVGGRGGRGQGGP